MDENPELKSEMSDLEKKILANIQIKIPLVLMDYHRLPGIRYKIIYYY